MTPIKVPGKNNRDQRRSIIAANRSNKRPRPQGRPPKLLVPNAARDLIPCSVIPKKLSRRRSLKNLKSRRKMAALEKLPTELLIPIFLFSMNVDLARASPIIAGKLSSPHIYVEAIMNAFGPTWEYDYDLVKGDGRTRAPLAGDPKLQSVMLRCRCATLATLRQAEETWLLRKASLRETIKLSHSYRFDWHRSRWREKTVDDRFLEDYNDFQELSNASTIGDIHPTRPQWRWTGFLKMHPNLEIPESLLQGPWTLEMVEYLFWLTRADARIHWTESTTGEAALLGLKNAVSTGNLQVIYILQYLGLVENVTLNLLKWATQHAGGDKLEVIARLMGMYVQRPHQDFRLVRLAFAGELSRMRMAAREQDDEGQDKEQALTLVDALETYWANLTGVPFL